MPAYNEEANIRDVVAEWYPILQHGNENSKMVITVTTPKSNYAIEAGENYSMRFRKRFEVKK